MQLYIQHACEAFSHQSKRTMPLKISRWFKSALVEVDNSLESIGCRADTCKDTISRQGACH